MPGERPCGEIGEVQAPATQALEVTHCPLCECGDCETVVTGCDRMLGNPGEFHLVRCSECGLHYLNPRPVQAANYYGADYEPHVDGGPKVRRWPRRIVRTLKEDLECAILRYYLGYPPPHEGRVFARALLWPFYIRFTLHERNWRKLAYEGRGELLDVGCGTGRYLEWVCERGWTARGIDVLEDAVARARRKGLEAVTGDLVRSCPWKSGSFDVVTMWDVIEHLSEPVATLRVIHGLLRAGGRLVIATPNIDSLPARLLGTYWMPLEMPRHLTLFSPSTIGVLLEKTGFCVERIRFRRRGTGIADSVPYLPEGRLKSLCRILRMRHIRKLIGTVLALARQSDEMVVFARKVGES
ncbi:MAG: class I SAM-dependent methyltransferase [Candidatus Abyssubacteria bacterium]